MGCPSGTGPSRASKSETSGTFEDVDFIIIYIYIYILFEDDICLWYTWIYIMYDIVCTQVHRVISICLCICSIRI